VAPLSSQLAAALRELPFVADILPVADRHYLVRGSRHRQRFVQASGAFLTKPGISVLREAQVAVQAGQVTAMHDPTEGGLAAALWELAEAGGRALIINRSAIPIPPLSGRICAALGLDPLAAIASGALLLAAPAGDSSTVCRAVQEAGIACAEIGQVLDEPPAVWLMNGEGRRQLLSWPERDEIARLYATGPGSGAGA
jgi:hydrogenase expression/formation protein HypE